MCTSACVGCVPVCGVCVHVHLWYVCVSAYVCVYMCKCGVCASVCVCAHARKRTKDRRGAEAREARARPGFTSGVSKACCVCLDKSLSLACFPTWRNKVGVLDYPGFLPSEESRVRAERSSYWPIGSSFRVMLPHRLLCGFLAW